MKKRRKTRDLRGKGQGGIRGDLPRTKSGHHTTRWGGVDPISGGRKKMDRLARSAAMERRDGDWGAIYDDGLVWDSEAAEEVESMEDDDRDGGVCMECGCDCDELIDGVCGCVDGDHGECPSCECDNV